MRIVVVGGGSWGTAFSRVLANREHEVTLACRDPEQARQIAATGRNPRYLTHTDLTACRGDDDRRQRRLQHAELVVLAVPSAAYAGVAADLPGHARPCSR